MDRAGDGKAAVWRIKGISSLAGCVVTVSLTAMSTRAEVASTTSSESTPFYSSWSLVSRRGTCIFGIDSCTTRLDSLSFATITAHHGS